MSTNVCARVLGGLCGWSSPFVAFLGSDSGAFAALGGEEVGVAGVGVAPAQVGVQAAGEDGVVGVVGVVQDELAQRPEVRFDGVGPGTVGRGEAQFDVVAGRPVAQVGGFVRREVVQDDVDGIGVAARGPDGFSAATVLVADLRARTTPHSASSLIE